MSEYNIAFFKLYERFFLKLKEKLGEKGIDLWKETMKDALVISYRESGAKKNGGINEFIKFVEERDKSVGLQVTFELTNDGFIYRFHNDPFPGLKGHIEWKTIVDSYLSVKRDFFLGEGWVYHTPKHIWDGDEYTEHIFKKF
jgi:hypothetical protein